MVIYDKIKREVIFDNDSMDLTCAFIQDIAYEDGKGYMAISDYGSAYRYLNLWHDHLLMIDSNVKHILFEYFKINLVVTKE